MVNNFIGQLGQDMSQDDKRRVGNFGNSMMNLFSSWGGNQGGGFNFGSFGGGDSAGGGMPWGAIGAAAKSGYNMISGKDDKDYSDTEQSVIYPLQGASKGARFGPWGALGGALYGLGYSFKDDIGLKNNNFLTQMLFPLDMGDGGGIRIGKNSITKGIL